MNERDLTRQVLTRLPWLLWLLALLFAGLGLLLLLQNQGTPVGERWGVRGETGLFALIFPMVGALIASRQVGNWVGWILCLSGLSSGVQFFLEEYAIYTLQTAPASLPGGLFAAWVQQWIWVPTAVPVWNFLALLFPSGRLSSPRWRIVVVLSLIGFACLTVGSATRPGPLQGVTIYNPLAIENAVFVYLTLIVGLGLVVATALASMLSLIGRFRRSRGVERNQLKWFVYAGVLLAASLPLAGTSSMALQSVVLITTLGIPIAVGIAILRHRLYDIDLLINRTLVYGLLTAALTLVYFSSVALLQTLFGELIGTDESEFTLVLSTLTIAGLFFPLRSQIQDFIDRRFYRRKYNAQQTLAAFSTAVRNEVELERLTAELLRIVDETMQPAGIGLWLATTRLESANPGQVQEQPRYFGSSAAD